MPQKRFEGSDRQVRGLVLAELRARDIPITEKEVAAIWPDSAQVARAISSLLADGLVVHVDSGYTLPH